MYPLVQSEFPPHIIDVLPVPHFPLTQVYPISQVSPTEQDLPYSMTHIPPMQSYLSTHASPAAHTPPAGTTVRHAGFIPHLPPTQVYPLWQVSPTEQDPPYSITHIPPMQSYLLTHTSPDAHAPPAGILLSGLTHLLHQDLEQAEV